MKSDFISRRGLLRTTAISVAGLGLWSATAGTFNMSAAAVADEAEGFIAFSKFATGHDALDHAVGRSLYEGFVTLDKEFASRLAGLAALRSKGQYADVEAMEEAMRGHPLHDTLMHIVRGWYSGVIEEGTNAKVYTYTHALMYKPAADVVILPTYAHDGPDYWVADPAPADQMPNF